MVAPTNLLWVPDCLPMYVVAMIVSLRQRIAFRKKLNTAKDNIDIVLNLGNNDLILVECKTVKESGYNKFSSVSRQLKAYVDLAKHNEIRLVKSYLRFRDELLLLRKIQLPQCLCHWHIKIQDRCSDHMTVRSQ